MRLFRIMHRLLWRRTLWMALFIVMLAFNGVLLALYVRGSRNQLILNPQVKIFLPLYRSARDFVNNIIDAGYVFQMRRDVGISQYRLEVTASDLRRLNEALPSSLSDEVLSGALSFSEDLEDTVPGTFHYNGQSYDVKVRYRGLNPNHWTREKKSWQIAFSKKTPFEGLRTMKLIISDDRGYFAEILNNYRAQKLGLLFPRAELVQLYVNNDYHGVYFGVEDFSPEFLERNERPADAGVYVTDEPVREGRAFEGIGFWRKETNDAIFDFENFSELDFLLAQMRRPDFPDIAEDIIDMESFYSWNIVALLAGSDHQSDLGNMRLYFNNAKGKFEFIPWDVWDGGLGGNPQLETNNALAEMILSEPKFYLRRNQLLWEYVSNVGNLKDDLAYYDKLYQEVRGAFYSDFKKHENNITFNRKVADIRSQYTDAFHRTQDLFGQDSFAVTVRHDASARSITLSFDVESFAGLHLDNIELPGGSQLASDVGQYLFRQNEEVAVSYIGNAVDGISKIKLKLSNAVTGESVKAKPITYVDHSTFAHFSGISATIDEFVRKHPQFRRQGDEIVLFAGTHVFNNDVVAPKGTVVRIYPGATISFAPGASFVSYSPVVAQGTAARPITLRPLVAGQSWGSFAVVNARDEESVLDYVTATGGSSDYINGANLLGMVSAYYSDISISNATISQSASDDGINVKYGNVSITSSMFANNSADGLDVDYVTGIVEGNTFTDNGNDGIDVSGSRVVIRSNRITGSGDKCISIGERTVGTVILNTIMDACTIGIEVKDNSVVPIADSVITNNGTGINAYMKKPLYTSGGTVHVYNSIIEHNSTETQIDEHSEIINHGSERFNLE